MKRLLVTLALTCVLSGSAFAGVMDTAGAPAPLAGDVDTAGAPAPVPGETSGPPSPGDMGNGGLALLILDLLF